MDERPNAACCLFASEEEIETDAEQYDCESCVVAQALTRLWPENARAWHLSRTLLTRFSHELQIAPLVLDRLTRDDDPEAFTDLVDRLAIIYAELVPAPQAPGA